MSDKIINISGLSGGYKDKIIFDNLDLNIIKGSFTAIAGPNGSGKSTLLKYLIKEIETKQDCIYISDKNLRTMNQLEVAKNLSLVSQFSKPYYDFTVQEIVSMGLYSHGNKINSLSKVNEAMKIVEINHLSSKLVTEISGGELQLTMLARAICQDTPVMLLDEPVNNLDPYHSIKLMNLLKRLSKSGKTIICVLHDLNMILEYCTDCIMLKDGKVVKSGEATEVVNEDTVKKIYGLSCKIINLDDGHRLLTFCYNR